MNQLVLSQYYLYITNRINTVKIKKILREFLEFDLDLTT